MTERKKQLAIGIDLGNTNSAVGVWWNQKVEIVENNEGSRKTPSYAYYSNNENFVGRIARTRLNTDAKNVLFDAKKLLGKTISAELESLKEFWPFKIGYKEEEDPKKVYYITSENEYIPPEKVFASVLEFLLYSVRKRLDVKNDTEIKAVITIPAYFNMTQKRATMKAAEEAGINVIQLLSEPVAAAISYQYETKISKFQNKEIIFVFDFGDSTFDVTIMRIENNTYRVIALGGDPYLGERDFDNILARIIENALKVDVGNEVVEKLKGKDKYRFRLSELARTTKETLTTTNNETIPLSDVYSESKENLTINLSDFERTTKQLIDKIEKHCRSTLRDAKLEPDQINHIVFVGDSTKMNCVERIIWDIFGKGRSRMRNLNADEAIAKGATVFAAKLLNVASDEEVQSLNVQDALPLSIGIGVAGNKFKPILEHNSSIPSRNNIILTTSEDFQKTATIPIYEGLSEDISKDKYIAEIEIDGLPRKKAGEVKIEVILYLDINGILNAKAKIMETNIVVKTEINYDHNFEFN